MWYPPAESVTPAQTNTSVAVGIELAAELSSGVDFSYPPVTDCGYRK
jgi:hypothetical protein